MKTYKEMAERVLLRRDEHEERKQRRRKTAGAVSVSVFASLVLVVSMILGPMFGTLLKKPAPASPVTDASSNETAETRSVSTEEQTDDITAETTGEQTTTDEQTTKDVQTTIETEAWELIDVSELSGYTVYAWDNDYGMNVLFGSEKPEDFHTLSSLISDADSGSVTKTFEYNGKSVELTYAGTKDSSLGDMGKISVYTYNDADFSEVILGRINEKFTSEVSFYENGEIYEISGSLLGSVETDGGYDIEALKAAVMEKYGETFDFSRYEFSDTGEHRAADGKTVNGITYRWYNEKCGARVNDGIFISVFVNGIVSRIIYPSREYIKDLDVKFTFDELTAIVNDKTEKALAERGYKRITPEEKDIYHAWKFDVYRGKPAFYCQDAVYYVGGDNKFYPDGDTRTRTVLVAYLIVIDNQ